MLIGELANAAGATVRALRYYEQQGLLHPGRAANGYREYDETAVGLVSNIRLLLSLGLTSHDVRAFLPCLGEDIADAPVCAASSHVIARRLAEVEKKMSALDVVRTRLVDVLTQADGQAE